MHARTRAHASLSSSSQCNRHTHARTHPRARTHARTHAHTHPSARGGPVRTRTQPQAPMTRSHVYAVAPYPTHMRSCTRVHAPPHTHTLGGTTGRILDPLVCALAVTHN
eukprot:1526915-Pleurochrysis_carterae.AAC.2